MSNRPFHPEPLVHINLQPVPSVGLKPRKHRSNRYGGRHDRRHEKSARWVSSLDREALERIARGLKVME